MGRSKDREMEEEGYFDSSKETWIIEKLLEDGIIDDSSEADKYSKEWDKYEQEYEEFLLNGDIQKEQFIEEGLIREGIIEDDNPEEYEQKKYEYSKLYERENDIDKKEESKDLNKKEYEHKYNSIANPNNDIPSKEDNDCLNIGNDISAFAKLIAYKDLSTPLSIGLFGKWGSGKSFFMEKLESKIDIYSKDEDTDIFSKNIVHVKFNAWHYSDTNLWASMVYKIFDRIDDEISEDKSHKIYEELEFSQKELKKKEKELKKLEEKIEEQENRTVLFSNIEDNILINQLSKESKKIKEVKEVYENTKDFFGLLKEGWNLLFKDKKILKFLLLIPVFLIIGFFFLVFKEWIDVMISSSIGILGIIYFYYKKVLSSLKPLKSIIDKYNEEKNRYIKEKESINDEIADIKNGKHFKEFIKSKISTSDYRKHLGLISVIREDFEALEKYLFEDDDGMNCGVDRIVLYIDDLDRCSDELVVEVLEAVHLLLTFKLFVVVVGIDSSWVKGSLENKFKNLNSENIKITPKNYIEKIFQIPFKIDDVNNTGKGNLIEDILITKKEKKIEFNKYENKYEQLVLNDGKTVTFSDGNAIAFSNPDYKNFESLTLEKEEINYLKEVSKFIDNTPRTIKRFINTYRLLRSHYDVMEVLEEDFDKYKNIALFLCETFYLEIEGNKDFSQNLENEFKTDYEREFPNKKDIQKLISRFKFDI